MTVHFMPSQFFWSIFPEPLLNKQPSSHCYS
uniref:Uncharacterized protein n=1 Tax=Rhizophora mucronata TaxID=61149 RepID=A0A2P2PD12_RHIMU